MTDSYIYNGGLRFIIRDNRRILQQSYIVNKPSILNAIYDMREIHWQDVPCVDEVKEQNTIDKQTEYN